MTVTPILTLSGPLTLGPSTGAAGSPAGDGGRAPVAFALPPSLATSSIAYEAHVRGGEAGELEIVARVGDDVDFVGTLTPSHAPLTPGGPYFAVAALRAGGGASCSSARLTLLAGVGAPPARLAARLRRLEYRVTGAAASLPSTAADAAALAGGEAPGDGAAAAATAAAAAGKRTLLAAFGSHRARRRVAARDAGRVDDGALGGEGAAGGVADLVAGAAAAAVARGDTREAAAAAAGAAHPTRPPHDPTATAPHAAYPLSLHTPPGAGPALDAAAGRLADRVAGGIVGPAPAPPAAEEGGANRGAGGAGTGRGQDTTTTKSPPPDEFPAYVLARAAALAAAVDVGDAATAGPDPARRLRWLALLAALLRLRAGPRALRADPLRGGGMAALCASLGVCDPALCGGLLEAIASAAPGEGGSVSYSWAGTHGAALHLRVLAAALAAEDGDLGPPAFVALRSEVRLPSAELAAAFRELGAVAVPAPAGSVPGAPASGPTRAYRVRLLPPPPPGGGSAAGDAQATLGEAFPAIKLGRRAK